MRFGLSERRRAKAGLALSFCLLALLAIPIPAVSPWTAMWAAPAILVAAMLIAWAAESAQFFVAQGFALAILAWLQTLPEFAVEFVLAWKQHVDLLLANLTGSLRLLTGLAWPGIYLVAAVCHRHAHKRPLKRIRLEDEQCVEVVGLLLPLAYMFWVWAKGSLELADAAVLILMYVAYLWVLRRMPPQEAEKAEDLERIPRSIVQARRSVRNAFIVGFFLSGGVLIYLSAEPFLASLLAIATILGVPYFVFVQWLAPFISEFPEKVSAFYWARTVDRASMGLMNMVSSNINQWTLLAAMLPIVYSVSRGAPSAIVFDQRQSLELLMTLAQSLIGMFFLVNMELAWWEATALFSLWFTQFVFSPLPPGPGWLGFVARHVHWWVTVAYLVWSAVALVRMLMGRRRPEAFRCFVRAWRTHVRKPARVSALR